MCMTVKKSKKKLKPKKSLFTRTYYKILYKERKWDRFTSQYLEEDEYSTPFINMRVELGKEYEIPGDKPWEIFGDSRDRFSYVEGGCFHLYRTKKDAEHDFNEGNLNLEIVKAIVPKGTEYIRGDYGFEKCICVRKVRYEKI